MTTKNTKTEDDGALAKLVETSKTTRLSTEQEAEAAALVKASLLAGKAGIGAAVESAVALPWIVGVNSIVETWPALKPLARKNLLAAITAQQTEPARRFRLSLGRGMFTLDPEMAMKLIQGVCAEMALGENGALTQNDRQMFGNVLIGKDKPWLIRLPLADLKDDEGAAIIRCAVAACFSRQCPPLTQLILVRWIASAGRLATLPEDLMESIAKSVKRWHPKLQDQFKTDVSEVPLLLEEALKKQPAPQQSQPQQQQQPERQERPQSRQETPRPERRQQQQPPAQRPAAGAFDLVSTLRQIEAHVQSLKSELNQAKNDLRQQGKPSRDQGRRNRPAETIESVPGDIEEIKRHNQQLEETVTELRKQLEELAADHEDIAASMQAHDEKPQADGKEQLKALLGIKLSEEYEEFQKLAKEPPDEVFREHYRLLLEDVFNELEKQGIVFTA